MFLLRDTEILYKNVNEIILNWNTRDRLQVLQGSQWAMPYSGLDCSPDSISMRTSYYLLTFLNVSNADIFIIIFTYLSSESYLWMF